jgi:hypothetical protein
MAPGGPARIASVGRSANLLTLFVVPVFYLTFDDAGERTKRTVRRLRGRSDVPASSSDLARAK